MRTIDIPCQGYSLKADFYKQDLSRIVLVLIGSGSNRKRQIPLAEALSKTGQSVLVIDYSGHGDSPFEFNDISPAQHLLETVAAYDWITRSYPQAAISVIGCSYGGFLAANLIAHRDVGQLVLRVPAIYQERDLYTTRRDLEEEAYYKTVQEYRENPEAMKDSQINLFGKEYPGKTLVVVHDLDEEIPKQVTDFYLQAFDAEEYLVKDFKHSLGDTKPSPKQAEIYFNLIAGWLDNS